MFGFISSPCARCGAAEFPIWRGTFCGLARCLGREFGQPSRMLVNRDAGFLALLGVSLDSSSPQWHAATCCNPFASSFDVVDDHPAVLHAAAVSVCGLKVKLDDDVEDEGPLRGVVARFGRLISQPAADRAVARLNSSNFPTEHVGQLMSRQASIERQLPLYADGPTAEAFGEITAHLATLLGDSGKDCESDLRSLGRSLGALVYWRDAWDDREKDAAKGRFNPFQQVAREAARARISDAWNSFCAALARLPVVRHRELLERVLSATQVRQSTFLGIEVASKMARRGKRKRRGQPKEGSSQGKKSCWDGCGSCCDPCCDCGPGDSGCCDCCPCDCG